jgi:hypothetical protein
VHVTSHLLELDHPGGEGEQVFEGLDLFPSMIQLLQRVADVTPQQREVHPSVGIERAEVDPAKGLLLLIEKATQPIATSPAEGDRFASLEGLQIRGEQLDPGTHRAQGGIRRGFGGGGGIQDLNQ